MPDTVDKNARAAVGPRTASSGEIVFDAQLAQDDEANSQAPEANLLDLAPPPTNANRFVVDDDYGGDDPVRIITDTQAIPPSSPDFPIPDPTDLPGPGSSVPPPPPEGDEQLNNNTTQLPGEGAPSDDAEQIGRAGIGSNSITTLVNKTARAVVPRDNILDKCSSYTYSISIYLMSPEDYRRLMTSKKKFIPGSKLLMQSGGAPVFAGTQSTSSIFSEGSGTDLGTITTVANVRGRNQFFPLDYYIDDVEIKSLCPGKGTGGAHNVVELKFKIYEPNGISLLDNLYQATRQYVNVGGGSTQTTKGGNYSAQNYLMAIRFYGYDQNGNLIRSATQTDPSGKSDVNAIVEKFIPFQFNGIKFRVAGKVTEYDCTAVCPQNAIGTGQGRGVIPFNIELTATTLAKLFAGNAAYTTQQQTGAQDDRTTQQTQNTPDNANNAPNPTLVTGLIQALNKYQSELVKDGTYGIADRYNIVVSHPEIANASIVPPGSTVLTSKPMTQATSAAEAKDGSKQSVNNTAKTVSATAGMSIVQFIDMAVRNSDYIYKQQTKIIDKDGKIIPQSTGGQAFAWYKIGVQSKPIGTDPKRNDTAYEITYEIAPYGVNDIKSDYFPKGRFRGVQKRYAYWFTGENKSVISYEQDFNYTYYITVNSKTSTTSTRGSANYREIEKKLFAPNSPQSNQGIEGDINEPSANAADYLYSPSDLSRVRLTIVGDPAWIQQGEVWSGIRTTVNPSVNTYDAYFDAFLPDGTINYDAREVLFEVAWNKPADYNINTGLIGTPGQNDPSQSYIYKANEVNSLFQRGKFTQELHGVLVTFPGTILSTTQVPSDNPTVGSDTENMSRQDPEVGDTTAAEQVEKTPTELLEEPDPESVDPFEDDNADANAEQGAYEDNNLGTLSPPDELPYVTPEEDIGVINDYNDGIVREA